MVKFLHLITFVILCEINFILIFAQQQSNKNDGKFNPAKDAQDLRTAIEGIGTDEKTIIQILTSRTYSQRAQIATAYYQQFQKNLVKDLKNDLSGTLRQVVVALMEEPGEFLAKELNRALTSLKKEENTVAEILCTREKNDIKYVSDKYNYLFNKSLLSTIQENLSGDYKTFLETVITPPVRERGLINPKLIAEQVQYFPGESKSCGSENVKLMEFLGKSNYEQIRHVLMNIENQYNATVESVLEQYCSKPLLYGYRTTVQFAKSQPMFFARSINKAVIGVGTQDDALIRIIVSRKEIDLNDIKHSYFHLYQTPLIDSIASETSGDYKKILLALIGEEK